MEFTSACKATATNPKNTLPTAGRKTQEATMNRILSRIYDIATGLAGVLLFGPWFLLAALAVLLVDGPPVFFVQERLGKDKRPFRAWKIRTMREGPLVPAPGKPEGEALVRTAEATPLGKWLRARGVDEWAQFWNVLAGDMSVAGPRPLTAADVKRLGWDDPAHAARWNVKPGITGWAQIFSGLGKRHSWTLDFATVRSRSIGAQLRIFFVSLLVNVLGKRRVRDWMILKKKRRNSLESGKRFH